MIARKLRVYLEDIPAVANRLTAPKWGVRIRTTKIPQGMPLPYVRLSETSANPDYHLLGELGDLSTLVQCDVWAETEDEAEEISELIRLAPLSGYRGTWYDRGNLNPTPVQAVTIEGESPTYEDPGDGSDDSRFRHVRIFKIHHQRPVN